MIIGLYGRPSPLKSALLDYLSQKSFYLSTGDAGIKLEEDKNHVVDVASDGLVLENWKNRGALLIGIGETG